MSVLNKYVVGATFAGAVSLMPLAATAQDEAVRLTQDEWTAISIMQEFNQCIATTEDSSAQLDDATAYNAYLDNIDTYYNDVVRPYREALREYRDTQGYTNDLASLDSRMAQLESRISEMPESTSTYAPEMNAFYAYKYQYDALRDASVEEFKKITDLQIPEGLERPGADGASNAFAERCEKSMQDDMLSAFGSGDVSDNPSAIYRFTRTVKGIREQVSPQTFLNLTRAP